MSHRSQRPRTTDPANLSIDGRRIREARFDYDFPDPDRPPNPFERARESFFAMPPAEQQLLFYWTANALSPSAGVRHGWDYKSPTTGAAYTDELIAHATQDTTLDVTADQLKGALMAVGYKPTVSTGSKRTWAIATSYTGIAQGTPEFSELHNLIATVG